HHRRLEKRLTPPRHPFRGGPLRPVAKEVVLVGGRFSLLKLAVVTVPDDFRRVSARVVGHFRAALEAAVRGIRKGDGREKRAFGIMLIDGLASLDAAGIVPDNFRKVAFPLVA